MAPSDTGDKLVFPVGHYVGPFYPAEGAQLRHHVIRVGWDNARITNQRDFEIWALCHGIADLAFDSPWTRRTILEAAEQLPDDYDADAALDRLTEAGVVVEVAPVSPDADEFAREHRLQALLLGLGNKPDNPLLYGIGIPNTPPVVELPVRDFEMWQWGHISDSFWDACELSAEAWRQVGSTDPVDVDPQKLLIRNLRTLQILISHGAAYLDRRRVDPNADDSGDNAGEQPEPAAATD